MYRHDAPENCRLFILAGKGMKEELFREKFEQFGKIEDLWIVKDKRTNDDKGSRSRDERKKNGRANRCACKNKAPVSLFPTETDQY